MAKLKLTKKQFERIKQFSNHFETIRGDYVRGLYDRDVEIMKGVYSELGYRLESSTCSACVMAMVRLLAEQYYLYVNKYFNRTNEQHREKREEQS